MKFPVCILTAGKGSRMGVFSHATNKALLPIQDQAIISHIINVFPKDTEFIIAIGHYGNHVREYVEMAHPDIRAEFIEIDRFRGIGSGPGYSLLCCRKKLERPFLCVACDGLFELPTQYLLQNYNWLGISEVPQEISHSYCNVEIKNNKIIHIKDKERCLSSHYKAFNGIFFVKDFHLFWKGLSSKKRIQHEHQISNGLKYLIEFSSLKSFAMNWTDVGDYEKYITFKSKKEKFDFGKPDEFIYFVNKRVIKFFSDKKRAEKRIKKTHLKDTIFPKLVGHGKNFYSYKYENWKTLYEHNNPFLFSKLLNWLEQHVWTPVKTNPERLHALCQTFYGRKTRQRLKSFFEKNPTFEYPKSVNGILLEKMDVIMNEIPWKMLSQGEASFIHGDLHFDHILYNPQKDQFQLLDWREDFSGEVKFGDLYYDLAKLSGGIFLNYRSVREGIFSFGRIGNNVHLDFNQQLMSKTYRQLLRDYILSRKYNQDKVDFLTGLIYLNMSPLHYHPFDKFIFSLGCAILTSKLKGYRFEENFF